MPTPSALSRRLSRNSAGLLNAVAESTAPGVRRDGNWHYGRYHNQAVGCLRRLGLIVANPDCARLDSALRMVVVANKMVTNSDGEKVVVPVREERYISIWFDAHTGEEVPKHEADTESNVLTDLGREVLALLHSDETRFAPPQEGMAGRCLVSAYRYGKAVATV